jgi:hypothetical protein
MSKYRTVPTSINPDEYTNIINIHGAVAVLYGCLFFISIGMLSAGGGTHLNSGYVFSDFRGTVNGTVEYVIESSHTTTVIAEAVAPVYSLICCLFHLLIFTKREGYKHLFASVQWNPVNWVKHFLVTPIIMTQVILTCYITDLEKVVALVMLSFVIAYLDCLLESFDLMIMSMNDVEQYAVVQYTDSTDSEKQKDKSDLLAFAYRVSNMFRDARPSMIKMFVIALIPWIALWMILWVNISWQTQNGYASRYAFPVFLFCFITSALGRIHQILYLFRWKWWGDFRNVEIINILLPLITVLFLTLVSMPASL